MLSAMGFTVSLSAMAVAVALWFRPWRMLQGALLTPALAALVFLPGVWLLPQTLPQGLQIKLSGAGLLLLMLGWPLTVLVAALAWLLGQADAQAALSQWVWIGLAPATLALLIGAALRRWLPANMFVYTVGRAFIGTAVAVFLSGVLMQLLHWLVGAPAIEQALVGRWLMVWGYAFLTGIFAAIFVAFAPQWLAAWSDERCLSPP
jgi:uncharacterized membrane protein